MNGLYHSGDSRDRHTIEGSQRNLKSLKKKLRITRPCPATGQTARSPTVARFGHGEDVMRQAYSQD